MAAIKDKAFKTVGGAAARRAQGDRPGAYEGLRRRDRRGSPNQRRRLPIVTKLSQCRGALPRHKSFTHFTKSIQRKERSNGCRR